MLGPLGSIGLSQSSGMGSGIGGWWEGGGGQEYCLKWNCHVTGAAACTWMSHQPQSSRVAKQGSRCWGLLEQ